MNIEEMTGVWECPNCGCWILMEAVTVNDVPGIALVAGSMAMEYCMWRNGTWHCLLCSWEQMERVASVIVDFIEMKARGTPLKPEEDTLFEGCQPNHIEYVKETVYGMNPGDKEDEGLVN